MGVTYSEVDADLPPQGAPMPLDAATSAFLAQAAAAGGPALHEISPDEARALSKGFVDLYGPGPDVAAVEEITLTAEDGAERRGRLLTPHGDVRGVVVYLHGGGWVVDDIDGYDCLGRTLATRSQHAVLLVDYRKAPEDPFPAATHDAWAGVLEGARRRDALGADLPLVVAGDSAGGNLAAVVAQRSARDGGPAIDLQVLVYPVTDHDTATASYRDPANALMLTREAMEHFWGLYAPDAADRARPDASPLRAGDLAALGAGGRLAPALVLLPEHDVLRDEGAAYAAALREAGVRVDEHVAPGQMHGFFQFVNVLPGAEAGMTVVVEALGRPSDGTA
ncbi:alpha/beta hydrolase [Nocardioides alkalitolerans]|uniref:alpha/beta hydrolase n=1 Tax=Nocardioides alkalitolerans TaxID=281714 RepID=UPI00040126C2|nr:alpha/beta hydrolase [Nocardioides alkalitolerans]